MGLAIKVDTLDNVAEAVKSMYKPVEGGTGFMLDLDGYQDPSNLLKALDTERTRAVNEEKARKAMEKKFEGVDADKYKKLLSQVENDSEAKLLAEGKIDEVVQGRTEKLRAEKDREIAAAKAESEAERQRTKKYEQRVLDERVRAAAAKAGVHPQAIEDALIRARSVFTLNEDGDAVQLDKDGKLVYGKDGKNAFAPGEWLEGMKDVAPHWFPNGSSGGGAGGGGDKGASNGKTIKRTAFDAMNAGDRQAYVKSGGKIVD